MSSPLDDAEAFLAAALPGAERREPPSHATDLAFAPVPASQVQVVNWHALSADRAREEWKRLDAFVDQLRTDYALPPTILPPLWHRHWELVWELSALCTYWQFAYGPGAAATGPLMFHRYFSEARTRLRELVSVCGSKLDADRPTRRTAWPGEPASLPGAEQPIVDRRSDFAAWVNQDVARRRAEQSPTSQSAASEALFFQSGAGAA